MCATLSHGVTQPWGTCQSKKLMRKGVRSFRIGFGVLFFLLSFAPFALSQHAVFIVRHAEKATNDCKSTTPLNPLGSRRAEFLKDFLGKLEIGKVITSRCTRTIETARPLVEHLKKQNREFSELRLPGGEIEKFVEEIESGAEESIVFVVAHSNTIPDIIKGLGSTKTVSVNNNDYDNVFLFANVGGGKPQLFHLRLPIR